MKKIACSLFLYLLISTSAICASSVILLVGECLGGPMRGAPLPIAEQDEGVVQISFTTNIGLVDICIKDAKGKIVYQVTVDTGIMVKVLIDTTSWLSGEYVLVLTPENGNKLSGTFTL